MKRLTISLLILCTVSIPSIADEDLVATAASNGSFRTLVNLLVLAGLDDDLRSDGHFTVFAPTDEAFAQLPQQQLNSLLQPENRDQLATILKYHVVPKVISVPKTIRGRRLKSATTLAGPEIQFDRQGQHLRVNGAKVVQRNVKASNGYIQVIDGVLLPPEDQSVIAVAKKAGQFGTLLAAIDAAGLTETLQSEGPFTVFAPTDNAFEKLPEGTVSSLLKQENQEKLQAILKYHVIAGRVTARDAVKAQSAKTLEGSAISARIRDGRLFINDAAVSANDVEASNAIIHVIDSVLIPGKVQDETDTATSEKVTINATWKDNIVRDGIKADIVEVFCNSAGTVKLTNLQANKLVARVKGGGSFTATGTVADHEAVVYGGAMMNAAELDTKNTIINVYGGGDATVSATETIKISAAAGANVRYRANGATVTSNANKYAKLTEIGDQAEH